jgi:hypothetical protein
MTWFGGEVVVAHWEGKAVVFILCLRLPEKRVQGSFISGRPLARVYHQGRDKDRVNGGCRYGYRAQRRRAIGRRR